MSSVHLSSSTAHALSQGMSVARILMIFGLTIHHLFQLPNAGADPYQGLKGYTYLTAEALSAFFHLAFMCAVPIMSVISGYLLFRNQNLSYIKVMKKKAITVALPSFIWCSLWLVFGFFLYSLGKPFGWFEWANYDYENFGVHTLANGIFGLHLHDPFAYQFWFIHDLIFTLIIFPILKLALDKMPDAFVSLALVAWLFGFVPFGFFSFNVTFFFILGGFLVHCPEERLCRVFNHPMASVSFIGIFVLCLVLRAWTFWIFSESMHSHWLLTAIRSDSYLLVLRAIGVIAVVQLLVWMYQYAKTPFYFLHRYSGYSFFVFAAHYPIIELYKVVVERIPGQNSNIGLILTWALVPLLTVMTCIAIAMFCAKFMPPVFRLLNGGRLLIATSENTRDLPTQQHNQPPNTEATEGKELAA